jgi:hypothetical protein
MGSSLCSLGGDRRSPLLPHSQSRT